jgi:hypothetical protein
MHFDGVYRAFVWRPIANCPGRYRLVGDAPRDVADLCANAPQQVFRVEGARDEVIVVVLADGSGIISYRRADGSVCHTLNTPEGFARKLNQLGLASAIKHG